jgi:hypothetical protein
MLHLMPAIPLAALGTLSSTGSTVPLTEDTSHHKASSVQDAHTTNYMYSRTQVPQRTRTTEDTHNKASNLEEHLHAHRSLALLHRLAFIYAPQHDVLNVLRPGAQLPTQRITQRAVRLKLPHLKAAAAAASSSSAKV